MTDLFKLILGILALRFKARATLEAENLVLRHRSMCFAGERRSDRTSTIPIVFYLFGSIAGFRPFLRWLRLSGRRPSFDGTVSGFGHIGAGDPATVLADRRSRLSCARSLAR
jgi:hypothetical protein